MLGKKCSDMGGVVAAGAGRKRYIEEWRDWGGVNTLHTGAVRRWHGLYVAVVVRSGGGGGCNKRPVRNNKLFHGASLSCDIRKGQSVLLQPDLWECWCELSRGCKSTSMSSRLLMFNIQGPISVNINLITLNGVHKVLQNINKTLGEAGGDLTSLWFQL